MNFECKTVITADRMTFNYSPDYKSEIHMYDNWTKFYWQGNVIFEQENLPMRRFFELQKNIIDKVTKLKIK